MKTVYRHHATEWAGYYQSILESEGIRTFLKNESTLQIEGTACPSYVYAELCVVNESDYEKALRLLSMFEVDAATRSTGLG